MRELVGEDLRIFGGGEILSVDAPLRHGTDNTTNQLLEARFPLRCAELAMKVFRGHDVSGTLRPKGRELNPVLFEDSPAFGI